MPTLTVEIGFTATSSGDALVIGDEVRGIIGTATIGEVGLLTDVSEYVTSVTTRRGATRDDGPYLRYETGTATIRFRNDDRRFDPTNLGGPYVAGGVTQVEPMRLVQIRVTWEGRTYPVWRGVTDEWTVGYDGPDSSWAQVTCFDALGVFAAHDRAAVGAVGAGDNAGQRISRILNAISWPAGDRLVASGDETVQATTLAGNTLTELLLTTDTELGELWVDAQGRARFRSRSASYSDPWSRWAVAHFGDEPADGDTTVNLVQNPSAETSISGWIAGGGTGGPTLSQSATRARAGSQSVLVEWGGGGVLPHANYDVSGLQVGRVYTMSVYVWVPSGSPAVSTIVGGTNQFGTTSTVTDEWQRLYWTGTATDTTMGFQIWPVGAAALGTQVWLDGLQAETGIAATAYVDGDQAGCEWDGVVHTSPSRRLPELPMWDTSLAYDALSITNVVRAARAGGSEQTAQDPVSVSKYLARSHTRSDLIMQSDTEARMWAEQIVARTARPELRFASVAVKGGADPERLWPQAFGREIGDRVRVTRRPPGGGAATVRHAWVRGVEHQLGVDQDWTTTFVLEQARDVLSVSDGFGRTVSPGWGNADGGVPWTTSGGDAADYTVGSGVGNHAHPTVNILHTSSIELGGVNQSISADITCPVVPAGGPITLWVAGRYANANNHYIGRLSIAASTGAATLAIMKRVAGSLSGTLASTSAGTHSAGNTWRVQLDVLGTVVRARAWRPGVDSMPDFNVSTIDGDLSGGTGVALMSRRETGNTDVVTVAFDNFSAGTRQAWS